MEATLHALSGILLRAIPTFGLVILLHFYLKYIFFGPLEKVLTERYRASEGARKAADESVCKAEARAAEYENALRVARAEIYQSQEAAHKQLEAQRSELVAAARQRADAAIAEAKQQLAGDVSAAKLELSAESDRLAERIVDSLLQRRVA